MQTRRCLVYSFANDSILYDSPGANAKFNAKSAIYSKADLCNRWQTCLKVFAIYRSSPIFHLTENRTNEIVILSNKQNLRIIFADVN